jgi:hypothetical protein
LLWSASAGKTVRTLAAVTFATEEKGRAIAPFLFLLQDYLRIAQSECSTSALGTFSHWAVKRAFVDKPGSARQYELLFLPQEMPKWRNWQTR